MYVFIDKKSAIYRLCLTLTHYFFNMKRTFTNMAFTTQTKNLCSNCGKAADILMCGGCKKDFCSRHETDHREELNKQMIELMKNYDQLQQTISKQQAQPNYHPLIKQIDAWEHNAIEKIHQAANEARKQLLTVANKHRTKVADTLTLLTQELTDARDEDDYVETDLKEWTEKLEKLKIDLVAAQTINFGQDDDNNASLIPKIFTKDVSTDSFETWFGDIQITEHGNRILHGRTNQIGTVYSKNAYSSGQHNFRFQIEQLPTHQGFVFGIVSKDMCMILSLSFPRLLTKSGNLSALCKTYFHQDGICLFSLTGSKQNDIVHFQIDCDQQRIRFVNERKNDQQKLNTNLNRCKLPWRVVVVLFYAGDCVRFC